MAEKAAFRGQKVVLQIAVGCVFFGNAGRADRLREIRKIAFGDFRAEVQVLKQPDSIHVHGVGIIFSAEQKGFVRRVVDNHNFVFLRSGLYFSAAFRHSIDIVTNPL